MPRADIETWGMEMRYPKVADVMPIVSFKTIKLMLHVSDNARQPADCQDRLYKIRPLIEAMGEKIRGIIPAEKHSNGKPVLKTYNRKKSRDTDTWSAVAQLVECRTRNRESPGSNPRCYRFEVWAFSFTSRRLSRLSCINEYLAIGSGGNVSE